MNTNKLPPELVEKMFQLITYFGSDKNHMDLINECAQIAVEYADEQILSLKTEVNFCDEEINILKQQRDELLDFIKEVMETTTDKIRYNKAKQLINKIDGKE